MEDNDREMYGWTDRRTEQRNKEKKMIEREKEREKGKWLGGMHTYHQRAFRWGIRFL